MTTQDFLKTLKTAKRAIPCSPLKHEQTPIKTLLNSAFTPSFSQSLSSHIPISSFLASLSSHQFHSFLINPNLKTFDCLRIFNLVLHNQSDLSFKPDIHAHFTLICRLIRSQMFSDAESLMENFILGPNNRYPFADFTKWVEKYCRESRIITKLLNLLIKMYSDHQIYDMVDTTFEYMVEKKVEICERTCSVHLYALVKSDRVDLAFEFFRRMSNSGLEIDVYSLTIVVSGLCNVGELNKARELVEVMVEKGVKPNAITFNTLVDACSRRWEFEELDMVLRLMEREDIQFNDETYKVLIEGFSSSNKVDEAKKLLLEMQENGFEVETYLYSLVIKGYCRLGDTGSGLSLVREMQESEIVPCDGVYQSLISGFCKVGEMSQVKELVNELLNNGGVLSDAIFNAIVDGYQKAGMINELKELRGMVRINCHSDDESCQKSFHIKTLVSKDDEKSL